MSEYKSKIVLGAVLAVIIAVGLAVVSLGLGAGQVTGTQSQLSTTTTQQLLGSPSTLIVQLTDPPIVPEGTTSLNLTYSSISLLVGEPVLVPVTETSAITTSGSTVTTTITTESTTSTGQVTTQTVSITPSGGSAKVDLLKLQNISETIGSAKLPSGSVIYSVSFTVSGIAIEINGTNHSVTLATGSSTLLVTLTNPGIVQGTNAVLLDLNPTIVNTTSGYQMIPSSVGIMRPQAEISNQDQHVGTQQQITNQDHDDFDHVKGQVSANLQALSVSGSTTTISVFLNNTGNAPLQIEGIGVHGNFTLQSCATSTTTTTTTTNEFDHYLNFHMCFSQNEVVFVPVVTGTSTSTTTSSTGTTTSTSTTTGTSSCMTGQMSLVNAIAVMTPDHVSDQPAFSKLVLSPGQCITLTFSGQISFGQSGNVLVPSTLPGQHYLVNIIASNAAQETLDCALPLTSSSCTVANAFPGQPFQQDQQNH
jgi:hypothetical protein